MPDIPKSKICEKRSAETHIRGPRCTLKMDRFGTAVHLGAPTFRYVANGAAKIPSQR